MNARIRPQKGEADGRRLVCRQRSLCRRHAVRRSSSTARRALSRSRAAAAPTFSPNGLYLMGVGYEDPSIPAAGPSPFGWEDPEHPSANP